MALFGLFLKVLVANYLTKVAQISGKGFVLLENTSIFMEKLMWLLLVNFWKKLGYFLFHHPATLSASDGAKSLILLMAAQSRPIRLEAATITTAAWSTRGTSCTTRQSWGCTSITGGPAPRWMRGTQGRSRRWSAESWTAITRQREGEPLLVPFLPRQVPQSLSLERINVETFYTKDCSTSKSY